MANERILATEEMVGHGHGTKADTLNRQMMVEHSEDGVHNLATPLPLAQGGTATALGCRIKTGTYTGDGTVGQAIAGVGFRPKFLNIWPHPVGEGTSNLDQKLDQGWADFNFDHLIVALNEHGIHDNRINSLDADGFTVDDNGGDETPNTDTVVYDYLALG